MTKITEIRLVLGDQLNAKHSWWREKQDHVLYVMMEMRQETDYVKHHIQKITAFFLAMRNFAQALEHAGHRVHYIRLDDADNTQSLTNNLENLLQQHTKANLSCMLPDEYRVDHQLRSWAGKLDLDINWVDSEHFLTPRAILSEWFPGKDNFLMESFYRRVRKQFNIMMEGDKPEGGQWNYDHQNRNKLPKNETVVAPYCPENDVTEIHQMLQDQDVQSFGEIDPKQFIWPTTRQQARDILAFFCQRQLAHFGTYQDAMTDTEVHDHAWSLYHSRLSFAMNSKMLHPMEVVNAVIAHWRENQDSITINQVEGFVRQIIGWREFIRAIYWHHMPAYKNLNALNHQRDLPQFFWNGETQMRCLSQAIKQSLKYAYAHHIQRLMLTGNFALLAGCDPDQVDAWYLGIYIDALEWVELPNTRGMSQFADNGVLATKPYISSANYIKKMSNHCAQCRYSPDKKTGTNACPFNSLYWQFLSRHESHFSNNQRMAMMYSLWNKKPQEEQRALLDQAEHYLNNMDEL
tara:strand:+ start:2828 stop:4384 length:1557 start_codon:yes stop_codon:yes gene_type:complete